MQSKPLFLTRPDGAQIAYRGTASTTRPGGGGVLFCCGFHSDMQGTKATALARHFAPRGRAVTRFDYQGHGESSGRFEDGTIGLWLGDALAVLDEATAGPQVVVGSSMGGWMALLLARARPERVRGLVLVAPAVDFPTRLLWPSLPESARQSLRETGRWDRPSEFADEDYPITMRLIEEARAHHLLDAPPIPFDGPVRILTGAADEVVPVAHVLEVAGALRSQDVVTEIVKAGDHRLSTGPDIARLCARTDELRNMVARERMSGGV